MKIVTLCFAVLLLLAVGGCSLPVQEPEASGSLAGSRALFGSLLTLEGERTDLSSLVQDRIALSARSGRIETSIDSTDYLLLIVSRPDCGWTRRFVSELAAEEALFDSLDCRCALVLFGEAAIATEEWQGLCGTGVALLEDREGRLSEFYVATRVPSFTLINRWGTVMLHCEGYITPRLLFERIEAGDFSAWEPGGG